MINARKHTLQNIRNGMQFSFAANETVEIRSKKTSILVSLQAIQSKWHFRTFYRSSFALYWWNIFKIRKKISIKKTPKAFKNVLHVHVYILLQISVRVYRSLDHQTWRQQCSDAAERTKLTRSHTDNFVNSYNVFF